MTLSKLEQAAVDYVAARRRNEAAEPKDWTAALVEVDRCWHELLVAAEHASLGEAV
jgi:hypothetical protein